MTTAAMGSVRAWAVVGLLWLVAVADYASRNMITTIHGSLLGSIPMKEAQFGMLTSVFLCVYGTVSPFAGFLSDRYSRSRVIVASLMAWSLVTWLTSFATRFGQLLTLRALMGLSQACYIPAGLALIADYHRGATRAVATGIHQSGLVAGAILAGLGGWMADRFGWRFAFQAVGVPGLLYSILLFFVLHDATREQSPVHAGSSPSTVLRFGHALKSLSESRAFVLAAACIALIAGSSWILVGWLPTFLREQFHLDQGVAGLSATTYVNCGGVVGLLVGGALSDRWSRSNPRARVYISAIGVISATPFLLAAANAPFFAVALGGLLMTGVFRSFLDANSLSILCLVSDPRYRATGYGIINSIGCIMGGLLVYVAGALRDVHVNLNLMFTVVALAQVVFASLLLFVKPCGSQSLQSLA
jgi:MFS family permease